MRTERGFVRNQLNSTRRADHKLWFLPTVRLVERDAAPDVFYHTLFGAPSPAPIRDWGPVVWCRDSGSSPREATGATLTLCAPPLPGMPLWVHRAQRKGAESFLCAAVGYYGAKFAVMRAAREAVQRNLGWPAL